MRSACNPRAGLRLGALSTSALAAILLTSPAARGDTVRWKSAADGSWSEGANWDLGHAPDSDDGAVIDAAGSPYTVDWNPGTMIGGVLVDSPDATLLSRGFPFHRSAIVRRGTLTFGSPDPAGNTIAIGSLTVESAGTMNLQGGAGGLREFRQGDVLNTGAINVMGDALVREMTLTTDGTLRLAPGATLTALSTNTILGGTIDVANGAKVVVTHGNFSLRRDVKITGGGEIIAAGPPPAQVGLGPVDEPVTITVAGGWLASIGANATARFRGAMMNSGTGTLQGGTLLLDGGTATMHSPFQGATGTFGNSGLLYAPEGKGGGIDGNLTNSSTGTVRADGAIGAGKFTNNGVVRVGPAGGFGVGEYVQVAGTTRVEGVVTVGTGKLLLTGGSLTGTGTVTRVEAAGNAVVAPGIDGIGMLTADGGAVFGTGSRLAIDLATATSSSASDLLKVVGNLDLGATNDMLDLSGGADGNVYTIATYTGTLTGQFDVVTPGVTVDYSVPGVITVAIPEPASLVTLLAGVGIVAARRRRR